MDVQVASQWATLITTGILIAAPLLGLPALWWRRRKQNQRAEMALESVKALSDQSRELMEKTFADANFDNADDLKKLQLQLANIHATLGDINALIVWYLALTHTRTSELPGWFAKRLGHE